MEEEARVILKAGVKNGPPAKQNLAQGIRRHIEALGGVELTLPARLPARRPPKLDK